MAAALWGLLGPVARLAFQEGLSPLEVAFWRAALGGLLFATHTLLKRNRSVQKRDLPAVIGFGVVGVGLFYGAYQLAVETGGAALASVLLYTAPAWVALASSLLLNERITLLKLSAIALTLLGVGGVALGGDQTIQFSWVAIGWGLLAGWCYALYYPFGKHYFDRYAPAAVFAWALPAGAVSLWPLVSFSGKSPVAWGALAWISLASTYGAYMAYGAGMRRLEATRASVTATIEPVVAAAVAYVWWNEQFGALGYAGSLLVLVAVLLTIFDREKTREAF